MYALQQESDLETGNFETWLKSIQIVNTFHIPSSINELMFVFVLVNGIGVKSLVDTRSNA